MINSFLWRGVSLISLDAPDMHASGLIKDGVSNQLLLNVNESSQRGVRDTVLRLGTRRLQGWRRRSQSSWRRSSSMMMPLWEHRRVVEMGKFADELCSDALHSKLSFKKMHL